MLLAETVNFMVSTDYKERFIAEYLQVKIMKEMKQYQSIR